MYAKFSFPRSFMFFVVIALAGFALGWLDKDTHSIADLFKGENLAGLSIYCIPCGVVCGLLDARYRRTKGKIASMVKALMVGIPATFIGVIMLLLGIKYFFL